MTPAEAKRDYGATHYSVMKDGETPQMFYKQETVKFNDNTEKVLWVYLSFANLWMGSDLNKPENQAAVTRLKLVRSKS